MITLNAIAQYFPNRQGKRNQAQTVFVVEPLTDGQYRAIRVDLHDNRIHDVTQEHVLSPDTLPEQLQVLGYSTQHRAVLVLPRHLAILKFIRIPTTDPTQLAQIVPNEVRSLMPWPEDECLWGYKVTRTGEDGYSTLMITILKREMVTNHCAQVNSIGISLTHVGLSTFSLHSLSDHMIDKERPAILFSGDDISEYARFSNGQIEFSRGVNSGTSFSQVLDDSIALDIRKHGEDSCATSLTSILRDTLVPKTEVQWPSSIPIEGIEAVTLPNSELGITDSNALSIGASLWVTRASTTENLLPQAAQQVWQRKHLIKSIQRFTFSLLCLVGIVGLMCGNYVNTQHTLIETTQLEIQQLKNEVGDLDVQIEELQHLSGSVHAVSLPLKIMLDLYERTPSNIAINFYRYGHAEDIVMGGEAPTMAAVWTFVEALQNSTLLTEVEVIHVSQPKTGQLSSVDFRLSCKVSADE